MTQRADPLFPESWPDSLRRAFEKLPSENPWTVALSGGLDSVVLLHLAWAWHGREGRAGQLSAVHINHGLSAQSGEWADSCRALCQTLGIPLASVTVAVSRNTGTGLEDSARQARYRIFADRLASEEALLLAHHADDQAETQLYRMMRGAGLAGFAAMPVSRPLGAGQLYRPLLSQTRQQLKAMAESAKLSWMEDPSNVDERHDRNFLRRRVMPLLKNRWPGASLRMSSNALHGREALVLLDERARDDAATVMAPGEDGLLLEPLLALSGPRQRNLLQWWLRQLGLTPLTEKHLSRTLPQFLEASDDSSPVIAWNGQALRRFDGRIHVLDQALISAIPEPVIWHLPDALPWAGGVLRAKAAKGSGLSQNLAPLQVCPRQGGERIVLSNGQHQPLKKWLQARRLPPWERARLPLLWAGETLVAVADYWIHPRFRAGTDEVGWRVQWQAPDVRAQKKL